MVQSRERPMGQLTACPFVHCKSLDSCLFRNIASVMLFSLALHANLLSLRR